MAVRRANPLLAIHPPLEKQDEVNDMVNVHVDSLRIVVELDHAETQTLVNAGSTTNLDGPIRGLLAAAGVAAATINVFAAAVAAYVAVQRELISRADQGAGVLLTMPWLLPGVIIPMPRHPQTNTPSNDWATKDEGVLVSPGGDVVTWRIERAVINPGVAVFRLENQVPDGWPPGTPPWGKAFILRDGQGGEWAVAAAGNSAAENGLYAHQLANGQSFTFRKPGTFGIWIDAFSISGIQNVNGGDRVTFTWVNDRF
ncbi:hypothetical protein [Pseudonocardia cypriaca]|uniref:Uncharacterized protein n=1 Tax=Pseudonocardia cypriaca TaxID=882449 RepID=A0A543GCU9_9PSEU|nr:hypothetical protein [Pseudonocardia cypriaca]TQM43915.1 hypothetical protein FB388_1273 [Pseudonocardia cypriaca]